MSNFFVISDTHFSHAAMLGFKDKDGNPERDFKSVKEMDDLMVENWNKAVKPEDHVWHLGDVAMKKEFLPIVRKLNGHKRLIMGNHDIFEVKDYINAGFQKVMAYRVLEGIIMSHIPIHVGSLGRFKLNVHGHLHRGRVKRLTFTGVDSFLRPEQKEEVDERYCCVCVEQTKYTPISLEDIKKQFHDNHK